MYLPNTSLRNEYRSLQNPTPAAVLIKLLREEGRKVKYEIA